jgi:hypothetical protein
LFNRCGLGHCDAALAGGIAGEVVTVRASWYARVRQRRLLHACKCLHELCWCDDGEYSNLRQWKVYTTVVKHGSTCKLRQILHTSRILCDRTPHEIDSIDSPKVGRFPQPTSQHKHASDIGTCNRAQHYYQKTCGLLAHPSTRLPSTRTLSTRRTSRCTQSPPFCSTTRRLRARPLSLQMARAGREREAILLTTRWRTAVRMA